jgi:hypothetical protein
MKIKVDIKIKLNQILRDEIEEKKLKRNIFLKNLKQNIWQSKD